MGLEALVGLEAQVDLEAQVEGAWATVEVPAVLAGEKYLEVAEEMETMVGREGLLVEQIQL